MFTFLLLWHLDLRIGTPPLPLRKIIPKIPLFAVGEGGIQALTFLDDWTLTEDLKVNGDPGQCLMQIKGLNLFWNPVAPPPAAARICWKFNGEKQATHSFVNDSLRSGCKATFSNFARFALCMRSESLIAASTLGLGLPVLGASVCRYPKFSTVPILFLVPHIFDTDTFSVQTFSNTDSETFPLPNFTDTGSETFSGNIFFPYHKKWKIPGNSMSHSARRYTNIADRKGWAPVLQRVVSARRTWNS